MKTVLSTILALALGSAIAAPALACDKDGEASFPMPAATFQQQVDAKIARAQSRLEERLKTTQATADEAKAARARTAAIFARMREATRKAVADGQVTAEEAQAVREIGRELHQHKKKSGGAA